MAKNNGGPAFPALSEFTDWGAQRGMTLRDYFAAKALASLSNQGKFPDAETVATVAYELADAMLEARDA